MTHNQLRLNSAQTLGEREREGIKETGKNRPDSRPGQQQVEGEERRAVAVAVGLVKWMSDYMTNNDNLAL